MIKLITLDLDDTLWDSEPILLRAEQISYAWLAQHAPALTARYSIEAMQTFRRNLARARPELGHDFTRLRIAAMTELLTECGCDPRLAADAIEVFLDERSRVELFADVLPSLRELRRDYQVVALTNGNTDLVRAGVAELFEFCVSPAHTGTSKPDPRMFEAVVSQSGVPISAIVHVGDEPYYDVEAAHRAKVGAVWVNRKRREWPESYRRAHVEITSLADLKKAITTIEANRARSHA